MNQTRRKNIRSVFKWILWALLVQFVLVNLSGILYAYKLTHFYEPSLRNRSQSKNIFTKTWKLFRGPKYQKTPVREVPHFPFRSVQLTTRKNDLISCWYIPVDSSKGTIILIHGLGANKSFLLDEAYEFMFFGFNVMMVDLRAHGSSTGNTTTLGVRESEEVSLAYNYVSSKGEKNIILYGISMGSVVIAKAIYDFNLRPSKVILDMPFGTLNKLLEGRARVLGFPEEPFGVLVTFWSGVERGFDGFRHNTSRYVAKMKCPVLMQYGALDKLVTAEETNSIFKNIGSLDIKLVIYKTANHESFLRNDPQLWHREVGAFLVR